LTGDFYILIVPFAGLTGVWSSSADICLIVSATGVVKNGELVDEMFFE
jgi:hypothetical protein